VVCVVVAKTLLVFVVKGSVFVVKIRGVFDRSLSDADTAGLQVSGHRQQTGGCSSESLIHTLISVCSLMFLVTITHTSTHYRNTE